MDNTKIDTIEESDVNIIVDNGISGNGWDEVLSKLKTKLIQNKVTVNNTVTIKFGTEGVVIETIRS